MQLDPEHAIGLFTSRMDVNLDALSANYRLIEARVAPAKVIAVVKANGVGHGARTIARTLQGLGAELLAVSNFLEAVHLRDNGVTTDILVFNGLSPRQVEHAIELGLSFFGIDRDFVIMVNEAAKRLGRKAKVHIKIDTGMGRKGFLPDQVQDLKSVLPRLDWLDIRGIASHLASPYVEEHDDFSRMQYDALITAAQMLDPEKRTMWHFAASSGTVRFPYSYADAVRVGALLYGVSRVWPLPWPLEPIGRYTTEIVQVKQLPAGHNVGYRLHYTAPRDMLIGVVPVGTTDALTSEHADTGVVLVHGKRCRIIGICSCEMMIDLSGAEDARPGDEVVLIGKQGDDEISAVECAILGNTSYANLLTRIPMRTPRIYWKDGKCVNIDIFGQEMQGAVEARG